MYRLSVAVYCVALAVATLGCGGASIDASPVAGVVTYKGSPVEGADVVFHPKAETGRVAAGKTDAQGQFTLSTYVTSDLQAAGAVPGDYTIVVSKVEITANEMSPEQMMSQMDAQGSSKTAPSFTKTTSLLPERYSTPAKSPFSETVPEGGIPELKLELTDAP